MVYSAENEISVSLQPLNVRNEGQREKMRDNSIYSSHSNRKQYQHRNLGKLLQFAVREGMGAVFS